MVKSLSARFFRVFACTYIICLFNPQQSTVNAIPGRQEDSPTRSIIALRTAVPPKIDGLLDDESWKTAPVAKNFIEYIPDNGKNSDYDTEVRILYDDNALYIGAFMFDSSPDSIYMELGERDADRLMNADNFGVEISPYNDGVNGFRFKVSASGVQSDSRIELFDFGGGGGMRGGGGGGFGGGGEGPQDNWDAVWDSRVSVNEQGWIAEFKIPYSALRFPKEAIQTWGINFWREVKRTREQSSWNYVNRDIGSTINHLGELAEITNIKPPLRLSLTPYISGYLEKTSGQKSVFSYNGGMDLKFGLNESFTIDATLVPDFGQVQSDDQILNLTPYEVRYNEKRPFFMEGTELFDKGEIFYSRRIGAQPKMYYEPYWNLNPNERVAENPVESALINATKLSGRTRHGLGIGVFNAMTRTMHATLEDTLSGQKREFETEPFTNYNMIVLDQSLVNNSYISIMNTNVYRDYPKNENYYTANVTGTDFMLRNRSKMYSISGRAALSQKYYDTIDTEYGHSYNLRFGKTGGAFRVEYTLNGMSETYDPNDMGYIRRNNEFENEIDVSYNINRPVWVINSSRNSLQYNHSKLYSPRVYTQSQIRLSSFTVFRKFWSLNMSVEYTPNGVNDYYEPRVEGRYYHTGRELQLTGSFDSNRNKKLYIGLRAWYTKIWSEFDQHQYMLSLNSGLRMSNRFSVNHQFMLNTSVNDMGYVNNNETGDVFFGKRNNKTITNTLSSGYKFSAVAYLSFRLRHYWAIADYTNDFYLLNSDGSLNGMTDYSGNHDSNYNSFNIDMQYNWRFAPGSDISIVWKNAIYCFGDVVFNNFSDNLDYMFSSPQSNSISMKILYYLDYQNVKKRR